MIYVIIYYIIYTIYKYTFLYFDFIHTHSYLKQTFFKTKAKNARLILLKHVLLNIKFFLCL